MGVSSATLTFSVAAVAEAISRGLGLTRLSGAARAWAADACETTIGQFR
jgi:hypothetical protein